MSQPLYAVYGASGFGREVMPLAREQLTRQSISAHRLVFIDDSPAAATAINGHHVMTFTEFITNEATDRYVVLAIANSTVRERLAQRCRDEGIRAWQVQAANVVIMDDVCLGEGTILSPFVTLTSNIRIGHYFHANIYSYIAHDCLVGDYVTFAPGVQCNGNIVIEDHVYIGTGAVIKQGRPGAPLTIGQGAVIGMGAVVTKDVPPGTTVVGNPAKPLIKDR